MSTGSPVPPIPAVIRAAIQPTPQPKSLLHLDISKWGHRPPPQCSWLFYRVVAKGEVGLLAGRSNSGKGMLSMEMAACVATGRPLFGRQGDGKPRHALVVQMEDSAEELERRYVRLRDLLRQDPNWGEAEDISLLLHMHFFIPNWEAEGGKSLVSILPSLEASIKEVKRDGQEVGLIVLDTLAALTEGDENSVEAQRALWPSCYKLRDLSGAAVLVIHHVRKKANNTKPEPIMDRLNFDSLRGSTSIVAGARSVLQLESLTEAEAGKVGLDEEKAQRGGYALLGLTKVVSGPKGDTLLLEQQEDVGGGFWAIHANTEKLCAQLRSRGATARLSQDEEVLLSIANGAVEGKALAMKHWPKEGQQIAAAHLKAVMNRLRNRHYWIVAGRSMELTEAGRRKAAELQGEGQAKEDDLSIFGDDFDD